MRVFVLCTGRSGSLSFIKACRHISNYSSGHESLTHKTGRSRFEYPDGHIEADNRLCWFFGTLDKTFGNDAFYVHLKRDKALTVKSYSQRAKSRLNIVRAFSEGVLVTPMETLDKEQWLEICNDYYDTINANIEHFLKDKDKKLTLSLENIREGYKQFWQLIGAKGDFEAALKELEIRHNQTVSRKKRNYLKALKGHLRRALWYLRWNIN